MPKRKRKNAMDKKFDRIMELFFPMLDKVMAEKLDPITMLYAITQFTLAVCAGDDGEELHDRVNAAFWRMYDEAMKAPEAKAVPKATIGTTLTKH